MKLRILTVIFSLCICSIVSAEPLTITIKNFTNNNLYAVSDWQQVPNGHCPWTIDDNNPVPFQSGSNYVEVVDLSSACTTTKKTISVNAWYNVEDKNGNYIGHCELVASGQPEYFGYDLWNYVNYTGTSCSNGIQIYSWLGESDIFFSIYPPSSNKKLA